MENNIVQDFQNLRVFSKRHVNRMDELVQDLTLALEESAKTPSARSGAGPCPENSLACVVSRRYHKRRRGARRAAAAGLYWKRGTISEASESSMDEAIRDCMENSVVTHSDSDDLSLAYPKQRLRVPVSEPVPPAESDSFTENLSPMRPQRRRRRYKHMAVDSLQGLGRPELGGREGRVKRSDTPTVPPSASCSSTEVGETCHQPHAVSARAGAMNFLPGKRKRCSKSRGDVVTKDNSRALSSVGADADNMDVASASQESSLSSSEFDSDVYINGDEGREADDEQSDFFHETDNGAGELVPWWDVQLMEGPEAAAEQKELDSILSGALSNMTETSQKSFRQRFDKMIARAESGRQIRIGRRKLKENLPRYTMMRFMQDRERWSLVQGGPGGPGGSHLSPGASWNSGYSSQSGDYKRLRQTPPLPLDPSEQGFYRVETAVQPESSSCSQPVPLAAVWRAAPQMEPHPDRLADRGVPFQRLGRKGLGYETQSDT